MHRVIVLVGVALTGCTPANAAEPVRAGAELEPAAQDAGAAMASDAAAASVDAQGSAWCLEGLSAFPDEDCYLMPSTLQPPVALLIYLHGVISPYGDSQRQVQGIVARHAAAHGYVALMPRGRRGIGPPPVQDWWSWPTSAETHRKHARAMTESWLEKKRVLETMLGRSFERTYLAGSSNGAFFTAVLAMNGEFPADGFGAMSGGSRAGRSRATLRATAHPPFYVGYGKYDELKPHPISLGELLKDSGWKYKLAEHNTGHGAREVYLDEALLFWTTGN